MKRELAIGLCLLSASVSAQSGTAQWTVKTTVDSMTDETHRSAEVVNAAGHRLSVYRVKGPPIDPHAAWLTFALAKDSMDLLSASKEFMYRIDSAPAEVADLTNRFRSLGIIDSQVEPKWINLRIWHGKEDEGRGDALKGLMTGKSIVIRYGLFTGGTKETSFDLQGAGSGNAIAEALGINVEPDAAMEAAAAVKRAFLIETTSQEQKCDAAKNRKKCRAKVSECTERAGNNIEAFRACIAG